MGQQLVLKIRKQHDNTYILQEQKIYKKKLRDIILIFHSLHTLLIYVWSLFNNSPTVAPRSMAWNVLARLKTGILSSNLTPGADICPHFFCVCVVLCVGRSLATGWSPVQGVLPTVHKIHSSQISSDGKQTKGPNKKGRRRRRSSIKDEHYK
jgi:hypothetical protein